jgi:hypothetical protein
LICPTTRFGGVTKSLRWFEMHLDAQLSMWSKWASESKVMGC